MKTLVAAVTGKYADRGNVLDADCVIGHSFGSRDDGPGIVNQLLAEYIINYTHSDLPLIVQQEIAQALVGSDRMPAHIISGNPSSLLGSGLDSWTVTSEAKRYMQENGLSRPILVAQAYHIGRVCLETEKQGIAEVIVPRNLPKEFDPLSSQKWTTHRYAWAGREVLGLAYLKGIAKRI